MTLEKYDQKRNIDQYFSKGIMLPFGKTEDILC